MPLSPEDNQRLNEHYEKQDALKGRLAEINENIVNTYRDSRFTVLKLEYKALLRQRLSLCSAMSPLVINLVDIQNDFVLADFALYAPGGENTVTSNMALLDAIIELKAEQGDINEKLKIITSQDAHRLGRTESDAEYKILAREYGYAKATHILKTEQNELQPFIPGTQQYGLHCMIGTVGAAIATPIVERLDQLIELGFEVNSILKINFSAAEAGLTIGRPGLIDISDTTFRDENEPLCSLDEPFYFRRSYFDLLDRMSFQEIILTGICGDVCVQRAAEGIKSSERFKYNMVSVLDAAVHYLVIPGLTPTYDVVRKGVEDSYERFGVGVLSVNYSRSNPESGTAMYSSLSFDDQLKSPVYNESHNQEGFSNDGHSNNVFYAFYLAHPSACEAVLAAISVAAVVLLTMYTLGLGTLAVMAVASVASGSIAGLGTFFYREQTRQGADDSFGASSDRVNKVDRSDSMSA